MSINFTWIDPDGGETTLGQTSEAKVKSFSGLGLAPLTHFLSSVPSQHISLHRGLKFRSRIVQLSLWSHLASATAQDTFHTTLLAALNPDRGEGILKIVLSDGSTTRYLACYVTEGPDFASEDRPIWGASQFYIARFIARDPMLYDPSQKSGSDAFNGATPVDIAVTNNGDIGAYPVISIATAAENPKIELVSTGEYLEFESYTVPGAGPLNIDCWAGTVELADGTDKIGELKKESTMFHIPRGAQTLRLTAAAGANQLVTCTWYNRYLGI